jgi:hypothetical protein
VTPIHQTSLGHEAFQNAIRKVADNPRTQDEERLATLLYNIYDATCSHPAVVHIVDQYVLELMEERT